MFHLRSRSGEVTAISARRSEFSQEHRHFTLSQQEAVATAALTLVDPSVACAGVTGKEPTGHYFVQRAETAARAAEREAWLRLSTLESRTLKTPLMLALATTLSGERGHDRESAVRAALAHSGGAITRAMVRTQLNAGDRRWERANAAVDAAPTYELRCAWQILRLASHVELFAALAATRPTRERPQSRQRQAVPPRTSAPSRRRSPEPTRRKPAGRGSLSNPPRVHVQVVEEFAAGSARR